MKLDVLGLLGACSYALDCVEAELFHVTSRHAKRVAYMSICTEKMGVHGDALQDLTACALLQLTMRSRSIFRRNSTAEPNRWSFSRRYRIWGCTVRRVRRTLRALPFSTDVSGVILYHHENADGSGPFGKPWREVPLARIIHLCDLLDAFCRADKFTPEVWNRAGRAPFFHAFRGKIFDDECSDAFLHAFPEERSCRWAAMTSKRGCGAKSLAKNRNSASRR